MPQTAFGAWVAGILKAGGAQAFFLKLAANVLLTLAISKLFGPKIPKGALSSHQVMSRSALEYRKIVYGEAMVSGPVVYNNISGSHREYLWYVVALVDHQCEDCSAIWFDGDAIPKADIAWTAGTGASDGTGTGNVSTSKWIGDGSTNAVQLFYYLGDPLQPVCGALSTAFIDWGSNHKGSGVAYVVAKLLYDKDTENIWKQGAPADIKALIKGRLIYDPRLDSTVVIDPTTSPVTYGSGTHRYTDASTWEWSDNPSLCAADYLTQIMGVDPATSIDWVSVADAADDCDTLVVIPPSASPENTEKRFTCNGALSMGESHRDNLISIGSSMDGKIAYAAGVWKVRASVWEASSATITADDLAGGLEIRGSAPKDERFNTVRGFFIDPARLYEPVEFAHVSDVDYVTRDNDEVIPYDMELPMTNTETMAQRVAYRNLEQSNNQIVVEAILNKRGANISVGDVVTLEMPWLDWTDGSNLVIQSEDLLTSWSLINTPIRTADTYPTPFATAFADTIEDNNAAAFEGVTQTIVVADDSETYTISAHVRKDSGTIPGINTSLTGGTLVSSTARFDTANGDCIETNGHKVEEVGDYWRYSWQITNNSSGNTALNISIYPATRATLGGIDDSSQVGSAAFFGVQAEPAAAVTKYKKTTTVAVTTAPLTARCIEWARTKEGRFKLTLKEDNSISYTDPGVADYGDNANSGVTLPGEVVPPPSGLTATAKPSGILLEWTSPPAHTFDYIMVYEETTSSWAESLSPAGTPNLVWVGRGNSVFLSHDSDETYYYWVRALRVPNLFSDRDPDSDTSTVTATSGIDSGTPTPDPVTAIGRFVNDSAVDPTTADAAYRSDSDGDAYEYEKNGAGSYVSIGTWLGSGVVGDYEVGLFDDGTGTDTPSGSAIDTWLGAGTDRTWNMPDTSTAGVAKIFEGTLKYRDASTLEIYSQASVKLQAFMTL